jgi:hypothetical protein
MTTHHLSQGISMSVRITSALMLLGLLSLTGCAPRTDVRSFTSAQLVTGSMDEETDHHALTSNQLAALSNWIKAGEWSGLSADIPDHPSKWHCRMRTDKATGWRSTRAMTATPPLISITHSGSCHCGVISPAPILPR